MLFVGGKVSVAMVKWLVKSKSVGVVCVEWCACVCTYVIVCISICACLYTMACVVLWCGIDSALNRPCTRHPERFRWGSEVKTNRWQNRLLWAVLDFLSLSLSSSAAVHFSAVFCSSAGINPSKHSGHFRQTGTPHFTNHLWHQTHDPWSMRLRMREIERKWSPGSGFI